jgi:hypothetical protein
MLDKNDRLREMVQRVMMLVNNCSRKTVTLPSRS